MRSVLFAVTILGAIVAWHGYAWVRLVRDVFPSPRQRRTGAIVLAVLCPLSIVALARPAFLAVPIRKAIGAVGFAWIGLSLLLACALLITEVIRGALWARRALEGAGDAPSDPARRRTLGQALGGAAVAASGVTALAGAAEALHLIVERVRVPLSRLPEAMSGTRIVQISDVHLGAAVGPEYLARIIAEANALEPDVVAITGDLVDNKVAVLRPQVAQLRELRARYGVYFVTGNHEYYVGADPWIEELRSLGVRVLRNERVAIGPPESSFDLAGVDDFRAAHRENGHGPDLARALAGRDPTRELVLLAHQPSALYEAAELGVGLQLSGHTHGGQIFPLRFFLYFDQPFVDGLHQRGRTYVYVNRGAGYWGPPMRVGATPEITEITLVRA